KAADKAVDRLGMGSEHDDPHVFRAAIGLDVGQDFPTMHVGQADIEKQQVGQLIVQIGNGLGAGQDVVDLKRQVLEDHAQELHGVQVIFNSQDTITRHQN